ncbi:NAD(P)(+) transhydrogenase (Re/Si-specific) subunit beta [Candidatus Chrysopegis kryptomonas]|uniref:NAD(P) transhydrogenase subunit beta n=1 Tax=Candidatus Chryseopegocella kryptomonas TaxID=1633643 RepID=A0A0P1MZ85_9BACT|nr:NAD(P)(+) transhydrogenase (Re/Si-specific) subunit beta [Candidatus Chrysopegis kryptomonas]CUT01498.1 NAD(P) transhydrogenase subunit beta [Candidatus Chrysopegis kryptomonas]
MPQAFVNIAYLISSTLFIFALKGLSHPRTAVRGNLLGALGMLIAIVVTLMDKSIVSYELIILGFILGSAIGAISALKVPMTSMPQMVAIFNGFGGGASTLVAALAFIEAIELNKAMGTQETVATVASGLIGAVTFWGSMVAFAKLEGLIEERPIRYKGEQIVKIIFALASIIFGIIFGMEKNMNYYWYLVATSSILGVLLTIPIGGADMPVVISLLNSYSGLAACATGFVLNNNVLIISGSLVGASGIILTNLMCKAMNRSLTNVLFGGFGEIVAETDEDKVYGGKIKSASPEEIAMLLENARRVVIVPGYGMAVSQAQFAVRDLMKVLESKGIEVEFAIHPVAGRMPGHMNVLLAEANIPYEKLKEMDEINPTFEQTDVSIVIGANDVVNPLARTDSNSPIAGMPILDVDKSKTVVVIKRSLAPGFAGIPNPLFAADNTLMLFGDAKKMVQELINALKES